MQILSPESRRKPALMLVVIGFILVSQLSLAQTGNTFWFAAPDVSHEHYNNSIPLFLHVTAGTNTHVVITRPAADDEFEVAFDLLANESKKVRLDSLLSVDQIEVYARDIGSSNFLEDKGFLIEATGGQVNVSYELGGRNNSDITVLKAENALGTDFWVSTQRKYKNHDYTDSFSGFVVVATEDGTVVNIEPNGNDLFWHGTAPFSVMLDKGQAFAIRASSQIPEDHIFGVHVSSDKDIAVSIFDDSMQIDDGGGSWDIFTDQLLPTELTGQEYVVIKGNVQDDLVDPKDGEAIFITSTTDNTDIFIDGVLVTTMALAGDYFSFDIVSPISTVYASNPVYVNHITGSHSTPSRELGGAVLPPLDDFSGSYNVNIKRPAIEGMTFLVNLFVRNDTVTGSPTKNQAIHNFSYSINGSAPIPIEPSHFTYVLDSAVAVYDKSKAGLAAFYNNIADNQVLTIENSVAPFHAGMLQSNGNGGARYGYFTEYSRVRIAAGVEDLETPLNTVCDYEPVQLIATGGTSYQWDAPYNPDLLTQLESTSIANPLFYPETTGVFEFHVTITNSYEEQTLPLQVVVMESTPPEYTLSDDSGCTPFSPVITNSTNSETGVSQVWTIKPATESPYQINQDTIPSTFELSLPANTSDTIQQHIVSLAVKGFANSCPTIKTDTISVLPATYSASFTMEATQHCEGDTLVIENTTSGDHDTLNFQWYVDGFPVSTDEYPSISLVNYTDTIEHHSISLRAEGANFCIDTFSRSLAVLPQISQASFSLSDTSLCGEKMVIMTNETERANKYQWFLNDTLLIEESEMPQNANYFFSNNLTDSVVRHVISLKAFSMDDYCQNDTSIEIILHPYLKADFSLADTLWCGETNAQIVNASNGGTENVSYVWNFDDATYSDAKQPEKTYTNLSGTPKTFDILLLMQDTHCADSATKSLTILPEMGFEPTLESGGTCSPVSIVLEAASALAVDSIFWRIDSETGNKVYPTASDEVLNVVIDSLEAYSKNYAFHALATNQYGCYDSVFLGEAVVIQTPRANFTAVPNPVTSGEQVNFTNASTYAESFTWKFSDDVLSYDADASFTFTAADTSYYPVSLIAFNGECADTLTQSIQVNPENTSTGITLDGHGNTLMYYTGNQLVIEWQNTPQSTRLSIYNLSGKLIWQTETVLSEGINLFPGHIPTSGIYFVNMLTQNGSESRMVYVE